VQPVEERKWAMACTLLYVEPTEDLVMVSLGGNRGLRPAKIDTVYAGTWQSFRSGSSNFDGVKLEENIDPLQ
jgi:hypothetical protein